MRFVRVEISSQISTTRGSQVLSLPRRIECSIEVQKRPRSIFSTPTIVKMKKMRRKTASKR